MCCWIYCCVLALFSSMNYETSFNWVDKNGAEAELEYTMPALIGPHEGELINKGSILTPN